MLENSPLGQPSNYVDRYDASLLFPLRRSEKRAEIDIEDDALPFFGVDIWNAYELSWLDAKGKPKVAIAEFYVPIDSPFLVESKSLKLYLNSFNQTSFATQDEVLENMSRDLSRAVGASVRVNISPLHLVDKGLGWSLKDFFCIDEIDVEVETYQTDTSLLAVDEVLVSEKLCSHLLKSNCLVTGQPDWGSIFIDYRGPRIDQEALLRYLISFRQHNEFHEQCVERIFIDLKRNCRCESLTVYARYVRRGGLDINPCRSTSEDFIAPNQRLVRQ